MLRHLTDAWKVIITAMKNLQYRYISGSGTYIKLTVVESFASECGKIWSTQLKRDCFTSLRGKTGENHLTYILAWHFLKVYVSLLTLGNEVQFKCPQEKMFQLTLWSSSRIKNLIALGTLLLSRRKAWQEQWALLCLYWAAWVRQTTLGPWDYIVVTDICCWSLLSLPMLTRLPCTCSTII